MALRELHGEELFDENLDNIDGVAADPCNMGSKIKLLLSLFMECL